MLMLIGIALIICVFSIYLLYNPVSCNVPLNFQNCSNNGNTSYPTYASYFQNCLNDGNTTTVIEKLNNFFSSSNVSTIYNSNFTKGGLLNLLVSNFSIFLRGLLLTPFFPGPLRRTEPEFAGVNSYSLNDNWLIYSILLFLLRYHV